MFNDVVDRAPVAVAGRDRTAVPCADDEEVPAELVDVVLDGVVVPDDAVVVELALDVAAALEAGLGDDRRTPPPEHATDSVPIARTTTQLEIQRGPHRFVTVSLTSDPTLSSSAP